MRRLFESLTFKIPVIILLLLVIAMLSMRGISVMQNNRHLDTHMQENITRPVSLYEKGLIDQSELFSVEFLNEVLDVEPKNVFLIDQNDIIVQTLDPSYQDINVYETEFLNETWLDQPGFYKEKLNNINYAIYTAQLSESQSQPDLRIFIQFPVEEEIIEQTAFNQILLIIFFVSTIMVAGIMVTLINEMLLNRIKDLVQIMNRVEMGDLDARVEKITYADEIGDLQIGVNKMTAQLVRSQEVHQSDFDELRKAEMLQRSLYRISQSAFEHQDHAEFFKSIHENLSELLPTVNIFFALIREDEKSFYFPYVIDEHPDQVPTEIELSTDLSKGGLTNYVIQTGKTLFVNENEIENMIEEGKIQLLGKLSKQWLGIPFITSNNETIGAMGLQVYYDHQEITQSDYELLLFVSKQIMKTIEIQQTAAALQKSEERFREIFEQSHDAISLTDEEGDIIAWNRSNEQITGYTKEEVIGKKLWDVYFDMLPEDKKTPAEYKDMKERHLHFYKTGFNPNHNRIKEFNAINKEGNLFILQQVGFAIKSEKGFMQCLIQRDITGEKYALDQLATQIQRLAALRKIDIAITSNVDQDKIFDTLLEQVTEQLEVDAASILGYERETSTLKFLTARGFKTEALQFTRLKIGEGFAGWAAKEGKTITINNLQNEPSFIKKAPLLAKENFKTYFGIPLKAKGELQGVLEILHREDFKPSHSWMGFLEALAGQTAIAMDNASLFQQLQYSNEEIRHAYDNTLEGWAHALELRDLETQGHSRRVTELTLQIARKLGISDAVELDNIRRGAILHDIGKMGIPDKLLFKPGKLTADEWELMRMHPIYGHDMLAPISFLRKALDIVLYHHEKWDGTGYPYQLQGNHIPLAARMFAVADVWDSLIHERPYKSAWEKSHALAYIQEQKGKHFDPEMVDIFMEIIKNRFPDLESGS